MDEFLCFEEKGNVRKEKENENPQQKYFNYFGVKTMVIIYLKFEMEKRN